MNSNKSVSFFKKLLVPVLAVTVMQSVLIFILLVFGGIFKDVEDNAAGNFKNAVIRRAGEIEHSFSERWGNFWQDRDQMVSAIEEALAENDASAEDMLTDAKLNTKLINILSDDVRSLLRTNSVTGAYVILEGCADSVSDISAGRAAYFLRSNDSASLSNGDGDLQLRMGSAEYAKKMNIMLDTCWTNCALAEETEEFYSYVRSFEPGPLPIILTGVKLSRFDTPGVTISMPLISSKGDFLGIVGVELNERYLISQMQFEELDGGVFAAYYLGAISTRADNEKFTRKIAVSGSAYKRLYSADDGVVASEPDRNGICRILPSDEFNSEMAGFSVPISIAAEGENEWVLTGIIRRDTLYELSINLRKILIITMLISVAVSVICVLLASRALVKPVTKLIKQLRSSDPTEPISLDKTGISEIDELSASVEVLSGEVEAFASKMSRIMDVADVPVGVFEIKENSGYGFVSGKFCELLDMDSSKLHNGCLPAAAFMTRFAEIKEYLCDETGNIYKLPEPNGKSRWIRLQIINENGSLLGAVMDITKEMTEQEKLQHERDIDPLTGIYNRRAFTERTAALFRNRKMSLRVSALVMWDLDNLKYVNDHYGHDYGDMYIKSLSDVLFEAQNHRCTACRRSGDEFYLFYHGYGDRDEIRAEFKKIWSYVNGKTLTLPDGTPYRVSVSGGVAWYPYDAKGLDELMKMADDAMYEVKRGSKGNIVEYSDIVEEIPEDGK
ncbi:MAG: GGDEF domain-containing protein [Oscillospiraceae bacterium]|nr:GGDEF domain-containing protein [Oscillospiraceae bacterium]